MLGEVVDDNVLRNYHCLHCAHTFSIRRTPSETHSDL